MTRERSPATTGVRPHRGLLQLALRGIQESEHGLTIGCWVKPDGGVSGCVFQHAYWQGVAEGRVRRVAGAKRRSRTSCPKTTSAVMAAIRALDLLGKRRFLRRRGLCRGSTSGLARTTVERLLIDALAVGRPERAAARSRPG